MVKFRLSLWRFCLAAALTAASCAHAERTATIFAAASLGDVLDAALQDWSHPVRLSLGGSGAIARQVAQGAPADVVMLADPNWMDWLVKQDVTFTSSPDTSLANSLVVIGPPGATPLENTAEMKTRLSNRDRLAIGEHRSVPAGKYAKEWLSRIGLWDDLRPHLAEVENVRVAFTLVARNEVPLAIVYASDLAAAPDLATSVWTIPPDEQPDIHYALVALTDEGRAIAAYLSSPKTHDIYRAFGFTVHEAQ